MAKPFPLQSLLDHSQHHMDAAERLLRTLRQKEEEAGRRLGELEIYRREYQERLASTTQGGMHIDLLRDYHRFLAKIEQAIRLQQQELDRAHGHWLRAHQHWLEQRRKVKAYETLANRHQSGERLREERRDQRLTDEQASKSHHRHQDGD